MSVPQIVLLFGVIAIVFDGIWASIAKARNLSYAKGAWVSFLIYFVAGGFASKNNNILYGLLSGMGVALIDATIGWWISWRVGPGRLPSTISEKELPQKIVTAIVNVTLIGGLFGIAGAFILRIIS